jgi:L-methionine (R)-S-oxide reductase
MFASNQTIAEIRSILKNARDRIETARAIAAAIQVAGNFRWVGIYDVGATHVSILGWSGLDAPAHPEFPKSNGLTGVAVKVGEPVVVGDVTQDSRYLTTFGSTRSEMIIPIKNNLDGSVIGTIDVESEALNAFTEQAQGFLQQCAIAATPLWRSGAKGAA